MEAARRRMQEKFDAQAAQHAEKQKLVSTADNNDDNRYKNLL